MNNPTKSHLLNLLSAFIRQRPGLNFANYGSVKSYRQEMAGISRQFSDAKVLLREIELNPDITAETILAALRSAFSGRLSYDGSNGFLTYCAGQYYPTEYRAAVCAVCARVLWVYAAATELPAPTGNATDEGGEKFDGLSAGDWLRRHFRRRFGRGIAARWFD